MRLDKVKARPQTADWAIGLFQGNVLLEIDDRIIDIALLKLQVAQPRERIGQLRIKRKCLLIGRLGFVQLPYIRLYRSQMTPGFGLVLGYLDGALHQIMRFVELVKRIKGVAQTDQRLGIVDTQL